MHCIHPSPSYSSAVQLLGRSFALIRQATTNLNAESPVQEEISPITSDTLSDISDKITRLDTAAKRALFAERIPKPVFFDTAFNYIDLPMDELLVLAGKKEKVSSTANVATAVGSTVAGVVESVENVAAKVVGREKTRESTPAPEDGGKPKGWLGVWFGKK